MSGPPTPDSPAWAYFHGTSESSALSLAKHGIQGPQLQANDYGFFGEGFYVSQSFLHAKHYGRAVLEVKVPQSADVFPAHELIESGESVRVVRGPDLPSWYNDFHTYYLDRIREAAVWETVPDATEDEVIRRARSETNPSDPDFDREAVYGKVTEYARDNDFDIVEWNEHENIIVNYDLDIEWVGESEVAESALRDARQRGGL